MEHEIKSQILKLDDMDFEIYMCGDQSSENLALFLHGFPEQAYSWRHQMPLMADLGYKVWAPNQRGYGKTYSPPEISEYSMEKLMADVLRLVKAADCKTVTLIAHDWGALVAWRYAIQKIGPLDKLVIMNVPHPIVGASEIKKWRQIKKSWYVFAFQIPWLWEYVLTRNNGALYKKAIYGELLEKGKMTQQDVDIYAMNIMRPGGLKAMLNWYRAMFRYWSNNRKALDAYANEKLKVPTLMIWGENDIALGIHAALGTEKYVEDFTIRYIPEASHFVQIDVPDEVNIILKAWLLGENVPGFPKPSVQID